MHKLVSLTVLLPALMLAGLLALSPAAMAQATPRAAPIGDMAESAPLAAPVGAVEATRTQSATASQHSGVSISGLFLRADPLVKMVMAVLLIASLCSWAIIFNKWWMLRKLREKADHFEKLFWSGQSFDDLYTRFTAHNSHPFTAVYISGLREWRHGFDHGTPKESQVPGICERVYKAMGVTIAREVDAIEKSLWFLASVASTAPFVGLFGTVWGIMNAFTSIAARHDTTLAVVAPGIAEALFATAMGLIAAIPAAFFYNSLIGEIGRYANRLDVFSDEMSGILSRQLDEKVL